MLVYVMASAACGVSVIKAGAPLSFVPTSGLAYVLVVARGLIKEGAAALGGVVRVKCVLCGLLRFGVVMLALCRWL